MPAQVTKHATSRMRHRFSSKKKAGKKMADIALKYGACYNDVDGELAFHFRKVFRGGGHNCRKANNIRAYGDRIYVFSGNILITVLDLPDKFIPQVKQITTAKKPQRRPA